MDIEKRTGLLECLRQYLLDFPASLEEAVQQASIAHAWFTPNFCRNAIQAISEQMLDPVKLQQWIRHYHLDNNIASKKVGIVMAGNIPLVGFHDLLSVFITGHQAYIKASSKDTILLQHLLNFIHQQVPETQHFLKLTDKLNNCEAIIATGNNQSAAIFESYFAHLPHIIRKNKTSVAVLCGTETSQELERLALDVHLYFGMGCRNVTKIYVPLTYDFMPLLDAFRSYDYFREHHKYQHNYDYQLSMLLLNREFFMTGGPTLLVERESLFSPISLLHVGKYENMDSLMKELKLSRDIQCIIGKGGIPFGSSQTPELNQYADNIDTLQFLLQL